MKSKYKIKKILLLLLPLLFSILSTYIVYSSHFSNYHQQHEKILTSTSPDYSIIKNNSLILTDPNFKTDEFLDQFSLDSVTYIGYLQCELNFDSEFYDLVIFFAPQEYYSKYSNVAIENNSVILDKTFSTSKGIDLFQNVTFEYIIEDEKIESNISACNFAEVEDVLTSELLKYSWDETHGEIYLFVLPDMFNQIFNLILENLTYYFLPLIEFSDAFLGSNPPHQIQNLLREKREKLDLFFDYSFNSSNLEESWVRQNLLERKLIVFEENYNEYTWARVLIFYTLCFSFCYIVISNTTKTYIKSQKEKIEFQYIRGNKRMHLIKNLVVSEILIVFFAITFSFIISILIIGLSYPNLLAFGYYYGMNIALVSSIALFYASIQLMMQMKHLTKLYRRVKNSEETLLNKIIRIFLWTFANLGSGTVLYLFLSNTNQKIESKPDFSLLIGGILVILSILVMSKKGIIRIGKGVSYIFVRILRIGKYMLKTLEKITNSNYRLIQLLILFGITGSFFLSGADTIVNYHHINQEYNKIGDLSINYPEVETQIVDSHLEIYVNISSHIQLLRASMEFVNDENSFVSHGILVFLINDSAISTIFNSDIFQKNYEGTQESHQVGNILAANWNTSIINRAFADLTDSSLEELIEIPLPITDKSDFYPTKIYTPSVIDIVDFAPFFSGISQERPFIIMNANIEENATKLDISSIYQNLWLKDNIDVNLFADNLQNLNEDYNLHIEIVTQDKDSIITDAFWIPSVLSNFIITLFSIFTLCLVVLYLGYYLEVIDGQLKNFRTFFARGLSINRGIFFAFLPLFILTFLYIVIGYLLGLLLFSVVMITVQP